MAQTQTNRSDLHEDTGAQTLPKSDRIKAAVSHAQEGVQDASAKLRDTALETAERGVDQAQTIQGEFDSAVRRNPTLAVLGAMGVGVVLGLALNKRA